MLFDGNLRKPLRSLKQPHGRQLLAGMRDRKRSVRSSVRCDVLPANEDDPVPVQQYSPVAAGALRVYDKFFDYGRVIRLWSKWGYRL